MYQKLFPPTLSPEDQAPARSKGKAPKQIFRDNSTVTATLASASDLQRLQLGKTAMKLNMRVKGETLGLGIGLSNEQIATAREECFLVYD